MDKFIYVFTDDDRDILISRGYHLLRSDEAGHKYIFDSGELDDAVACFSLRDIDCVETNVLIF